ncbi:MAG: cell division protein SepF [Clostridia bacterium]|nr:cell division protein SepF [Clostridia bacterium]
MGLKEKFKNLMFIEEDEYDEYDEEEVVEEKAEQVVEEKPFTQTVKKVDRTPLEKKYSVTNPNGFKLVLIEPNSYDECPKLVDSLKGRRPIIINLEKVETETAKKIFEFLSGATYALNGTVQRVSNNIFIFAPDNIGINAQNTQTNPGDFEFKNEQMPW